MLFVKLKINFIFVGALGRGLVGDNSSLHPCLWRYAVSFFLSLLCAFGCKI